MKADEKPVRNGPPRKLMVLLVVLVVCVALAVLSCKSYSGSIFPPMSAAACTPSPARSAGRTTSS